MLNVIGYKSPTQKPKASHTITVLGVRKIIYLLKTTTVVENIYFPLRIFTFKGSGSTDIGDLELLTLGYKADFSESNYVLHLSRFTLVAEIFGLPQRASSQTLFYRFTPEGFHY